VLREYVALFIGKGGGEGGGGEWREGEGSGKCLATGIHQSSRRGFRKTRNGASFSASLLSARQWEQSGMEAKVYLGTGGAFTNPFYTLSQVTTHHNNQNCIVKKRARKPI
jgi:hypothetical protein